MFELLGCQIAVEPEKMNAIVLTESSANTYAIGIVGHKISRQPSNEAEAIELVKRLREKGINYSVGLAQVNQINFDKYKLNYNNMFDQCANLAAGGEMLKTCYNKYNDWGKAYSCYYSGNDKTGFKHGYVAKVRNNLAAQLITSANTSRKSTTPIKIYRTNKLAYKEKLPKLLTRRLSTTKKVSKPKSDLRQIASRRLDSKISNFNEDI